MVFVSDDQRKKVMAELGQKKGIHSSKISHAKSVQREINRNKMLYQNSIPKVKNMTMEELKILWNKSTPEERSALLEQSKDAEYRLNHLADFGGLTYGELHMDVVDEDFDNEQWMKLSDVFANVVKRDKKSELGEPTQHDKKLAREFLNAEGTYTGHDLLRLQSVLQDAADTKNANYYQSKDYTPALGEKARMQWVRGGGHRRYLIKVLGLDAGPGTEFWRMSDSDKIKMMEFLKLAESE